MRLISKIVIPILLIIIFFSIPIELIYAEKVETLELPKTTLNPGSFYYSFKRLWEKGLEKLQFSKRAKINYNQSQLKTRLAELEFVLENKLLSEVETSSQRFAYQAGIFTEVLVKQNNTSQKENLIKDFEKYGKFLANLRDEYTYGSSYWMLVQHDINTLKILSDKLR